MHSKRASRRRHSAELRAKVLAACDEAGASVAAIAHAHDLNANLVHKWRRDRGAMPLSSPASVTPPEFIALSSPPAPFPAAPVVPSVTGVVEQTTQSPAVKRAPAGAASGFVPVQLEMPRAAPVDIRLELHRGAATVIVSWPAQDAAACGTWLREWLG
jgi:transposase